MSDYEVTYSEDSLLHRVVKKNKDQYKDDTGYEFSNGRKFDSSDRYDTGIYDGT